MSGIAQIVVPGFAHRIQSAATASDECDDGLSDQIAIDDATVNTNLAGTYMVTYNVTDRSGNVADTVTRTVVVEACIAVIGFSHHITRQRLRW